MIHFARVRVRPQEYAFLWIALVAPAWAQIPSANPSISAPEISGDVPNSTPVDPYATMNNSAAAGASSGRDQKAQDAEKQGSDGKNAALGAGAALVAQATPMLASPFPSVRATGAALMAKAALEFAQAGNTGSSENQNQAQKDLLRRPDDVKASSLDPSSIPQNSDLNQFLANKGINSDDFYSRLGNGELSTPDAVMNYLGDPPQLPAQDYNQALTKADQITSNTLSQLPRIPKVGMDDSQTSQTDPGTSTPFSSRPSGILGTGSGRTLASDAGTFGSAPSNSAAGGKAESFAAAHSSQIASGDPGEERSTASFGDVMSKIQGLGGGIPADGGLLAMQQNGSLERFGIVRNLGKQNVFQIAHRNFRSYEKWRRLNRIAHR